jgi:hypothetical protein
VIGLVTVKLQKIVALVGFQLLLIMWMNYFW